jgi:SAM-dependent methyltransferase
MAHQEQSDFVNKVKEMFPSYFTNRKVLEVGSYNVNGSVRSFFTDCAYIGIDVVEGPCVDIVCPGQLYKPETPFEVVVSCEMLEHNMHWAPTLKNMVRVLEPGGLLLITCASTGRAEHGTTISHPGASPSNALYGNYYRNLIEKDFRYVLDMQKMFTSYQFSTNEYSHDIYLWAIKGTVKPSKAESLLSFL